MLRGHIYVSNPKQRLQPWRQVKVQSQCAMKIFVSSGPQECGLSASSARRFLPGKEIPATHLPQSHVGLRDIRDATEMEKHS